MEQRDLLICDCSSCEHQLILHYDVEDNDRLVYATIHLVKLPFFKRLWMGLKYIFGYKCCYGNFEEIILSPKHARQIYSLYRFLRPKLTKEEIAKLANCNGKAVEIGLKERCQDICTSIEQSKHLIDLGLDPATSDMWWIDDQLVAKSDKFDVPSNDEETTVHCAWSLSALLEVMPKELEVVLFKTPFCGEYFFSWWTNDHHMGDDYKEPIDAAYEMVCKMLERGLIKKGE